MAAFDMKKLSTTDKLVAGAGVVALISLFLPWYGVSSGVFSNSVSGFSSGYGWIGALLIVAAAVYLVGMRSGSNVPKFSYGPGVIVLGASAIGTFLVALRWLTLPSGSASVGGVTYLNYGPRVGIILTLIAGIVQVVCAFRLFRTSGETVPWAGKGGKKPSEGTR